MNPEGRTVSGRTPRTKRANRPCSSPNGRIVAELTTGVSDFAQRWYPRRSLGLSFRPSDGQRSGSTVSSYALALVCLMGSNSRTEIIDRLDQYAESESARRRLMLPEVPHLEQQAIPRTAISYCTNRFSLVNTLGEFEL